MPRVLAISAAALLVSVIAAPEARAQPEEAGGDAPEIVGILHLETSGVSETVAGRFEESIEKGLQDNGFKVAPRARMIESLARPYAPGCLFGPCLAEVHRQTEVKLVLVGRITSLGPAYTFVMSLVDTRLGRPTSQVVEQCEVCTVEEAITTATLVVVGLVTGAGAAVVDPALGPTSTGKLPDFKAQIEKREVEIDDRRRRLRQASLFFIGAAALAGGAGAYFLYRDEDERGLPALGASGALGVASLTFLVLSRRF